MTILITKFSKYFKLKNYHDYYKIYRNRLRILHLLNNRFSSDQLQPLWQLNHILKNNNYYINKNYYCFAYTYDPNNIAWNKDFSSDFVFPEVRFDKMHIHKYFDKGTDVKIPWEVSRLYFAPALAINYLATLDDIHYLRFKESVLNFINSNPFLHGINWLSPMEAGIRAINLITALNLFGDKAFQDSDFLCHLSISLIQHGEFIDSFPEIYYKGHSTNHTVANYVGLLFISLSLSNYFKACSWIEKSITNLEKCMDYQVYEDGVDFEGSIPYHRLVLEMFAFAAIIAQAKSLIFSKQYYAKLFKMFEFSAAYIDKNGNAPQIGDDDSGRLLVMESFGSNDHYRRSNDHSYLLSIGEHIFNYKFKTSCKIINQFPQQYLPRINKIEINELPVKPRNTHKSIYFSSGGAYILKNNFMSLFVSCFPQGQNGNGGHNHLDVGSFTLSIHGYPVIIDPGTYTYTKSKTLRDMFRSYTYHNTIYTSRDVEFDLSNNSYWTLKQYYDHKLIEFQDNIIAISINSKFDPEPRHREFRLYKDSLAISNSYNGNFSIRMNLHPDITVLKRDSNMIYFENFKISLSDNISCDVIDYDYSPYYDKKIASRALIFSGRDKLDIILTV